MAWQKHNRGEKKTTGNGRDRITPFYPPQHSVFGLDPTLDPCMGFKYHGFEPEQEQQTYLSPWSAEVCDLRCTQ